MSADGFWWVVFGVLGLCVGSLANVVLYRWPRQWGGQTDLGLWRPASHCPQCQTPLKAWMLIPLLSWWVLRGRCARCASPIAWRYPLMEAASGLVWLGCIWRWPASLEAVCWALAGSLLLTAAVLDWQTTCLPHGLTQPLLWGGLMASAAGWINTPLPAAVWGASLGLVCLWTVAWLFARWRGIEGMGEGDIWLFGGLGAWLGVDALWPLLMLSSLTGLAVGLGLHTRGGLREGGYLPFGPFLAGAGAVLAVWPLRIA